MCGIAGFYSKELSKAEINPKANAMHQSLVHRGPDGHGIFVDYNKPLCLVHRRLAIIDPDNGAQPMYSKDGSLVMVFNGAIYNYLELRKTLLSKGHPIESFSDTEVLLYAYAEWGEECLNRLIGMFAFVIWDRRAQKIFCARDRVGIKPFYYAIAEEFFVFASEIKGILAEGTIQAELNTQALQDYLALQYCLGSKTLFKNINKLEPGCSMTIHVHESRLKWSIRRYWDLQYDIDLVHDEGWFVDNLRDILHDSIRLHLRADVPLGAHLSGGLDSSYVAMLAANMLSDSRLSTFTGAFNRGPQYDETPYARLVANAINAQHHEVYIPEQDFTVVLHKLVYFMDEPVAGPGLIPQYYVSQKASEHVKVVLGGQGGDEIFFGYARYLIAALEQALNQAIESNNPSQLSVIAGNLNILKNYKPLIKQFFKQGLFDTSDQRIFALLDRSGPLKHLFSKNITDSDYSVFHSFQELYNRCTSNELINKMGYIDLQGSLPALLQVEDRTSMSVSIESRVPLLDHRIIEFMSTIPASIKFSGGELKYLYKKAVRSVLPPAVINRKDKMGFPTPLNHWVNGFAKEFVHDTLFSQKARERGLYDYSKLQHSINDENEFSRSVWGLLCIEIWHQTMVDGSNFNIFRDKKHDETLDLNYHQ